MEGEANCSRTTTGVVQGAANWCNRRCALRHRRVGRHEPRAELEREGTVSELWSSSCGGRDGAQLRRLDGQSERAADGLRLTHEILIPAAYAVLALGGVALATAVAVLVVAP